MFAKDSQHGLLTSFAHFFNLSHFSELQISECSSTSCFRHFHIFKEKKIHDAFLKCLMDNKDDN